MSDLGYVCVEARLSVMGFLVSGLWAGNALMIAFRVLILMVWTGVAWLKGVSWSVLFKIKVMGWSKWPFAISVLTDEKQGKPC